MKRFCARAIEALIFLSVFTVSVNAAVESGPLPRNISIEVEFKEAGFTTKGIKGLPPHRSTKESKYTKQNIVVSDGLTASIRVGEDVPYVEYYTRYLVDNGYVESVETAWREVGTKLVVTPKIRGGYIEISLTPQISYISKSGSGVVNVSEITTTVLAADGQPVSIGGLFKDRDFASNFFKTKASSGLDIVLTPRVR